MHDLPGLTLRDAAESDVPAITAIYAHHVLHGFASFEDSIYLDPASAGRGAGRTAPRGAHVIMQLTLKPRE